MTPGAASGSTPRLYQRVFDILAQHIARGTLPAGTALSETRVAARFGISRAPARRALAGLADRGLIARTASRGYVVRPGRGPAAGAPAPAGPPPELKLVALQSWERIYGEVEAETIARASFASWRLNEAKLARHYGVSRTVAREVIGRLQQQGMLQKDDRSRWVAPALTPRHVGELYELRRILEPVALVKAAANLPPGLAEEARANLIAARDLGPRIEGATLDRLEHDLHVRILGHCGSRALMQAIAFPQSLLIAHRFLYRWTARLFELDPLIPQHLQIVEHLLAGRAQAAAEAMRTHLHDSRDRALARIEIIARGPHPEPLGYLERLP